MTRLLHETIAQEREIDKELEVLLGQRQELERKLSSLHKSAEVHRRPFFDFPPDDNLVMKIATTKDSQQSKRSPLKSGRSSLVPLLYKD